MPFFHSFPRQYATRTDEVAPSNGARTGTILSRGIDTLRYISRYGILCTPEWLPFSSRPTRTLSGGGSIAHSDLGRFSQSRFCVTALDANELYAGRGAMELDKDKPIVSHADAFGPFAIGFSDEVARKIGFMPTIYYSPTDIYGNKISSEKPKDLGVNLQLLQSLHDLRNVAKSLLTLEHAYAQLDYTTNLGALDITEILEASGSDLPAIKFAYSLSKRELDLLTEPFNFQRLPALYLLDHLEIILTLFQSTDDLRSTVPLEYFQQREWRLVQHFRSDLYWYSLGDHPDYKDENRESRWQEREKLKKQLNRSKTYLNAC